MPKEDSLLPSPPPVIAAAAEEKDQHDDQEKQVGIHGYFFPLLVLSPASRLDLRAARQDG
jgi:hypothetical protein